MDISYEKFYKVLSLFTLDEQVSLLSSVCNKWKLEDPQHIKTIIAETLLASLHKNTSLTLDDGFRFLYQDMNKLGKENCPEFVSDLFIRVVICALTQEKFRDIIDTVTLTQYKDLLRPYDIGYKYLEVGIRMSLGNRQNYFILEYLYDGLIYEERSLFSASISSIDKLTQLKLEGEFLKKIKEINIDIYKIIENITNVFKEGVGKRIWSEAIEEEPSVNFPIDSDKLFMIKILQI